MEETEAVRAILVSDDKILLIRCVVPDTGKSLWITPGGAMEPNETNEEALKREVFEETGFKLKSVPRNPVWERTAVFPFNGVTYKQYEQYYFIEVDEFDPVNDNFADEIERQALKEFRWWSLDEIKESTDTFVPADLGKHFDALLNDGLSEKPFDVGV